MTMRLLFVDDEPRVLDGIRRELMLADVDWVTTYVTSAEAALVELRQRSYDAVVSDMCMPEMDGAELLARVASDYPGIIRILLSGHSETVAIARSVCVAHRYLSKPCCGDTIIAVVQECATLQSRIANEAVRKLVVASDNLPVLPEAYHTLISHLDSKKADFATVVSLIERDIAIAARVLQLVNSSYFGFGRQVETLEHAVSLLGYDSIRALALAIYAMRLFDAGGEDEFSREILMQHSARVSALARDLALANAETRELAPLVMMAGMLHDLGKIVIAANFGEYYAECIQKADAEARPLWMVEVDAFGASHDVIGGCLLGLWGLPLGVVEAVAQHHDAAAQLRNGKIANAIVYAADLASHDIPVEELIEDPVVVQFNLATAVAHCIANRNEIENGVNHECSRTVH